MLLAFFRSMPNQQIKTTIESFAKKKILVIGDLMLDMYTFGVVDRISPEAPIAVITKAHEKYVAGGAANVGNNIAALGAHVVICGSVGNDSRGTQLKKLLREKNIDTSLIVTNSESETITKHRIVAGNQQLLRIDHEITCHLSSKLEKQVLQKVSRHIQSCDAVILSDYAKGFFSHTLTKKIITLAKKYTKLITADIKPQNKSLFRTVDVITPNLKEAMLMSGKKDIALIGKHLMRYFHAHILLTQAEVGMTLFEKDKESVHIPSKKVEVFDVSGAGDTVIAVATLALTAGLDLATASHLANFAAGLVVQKSGTATITREELETIILEDKHIEAVDIVPKLWGYEKWIENNDKYCSKILSLNKGYQCSLHYHKIKDEMFLVTKGHVRLELGDEVLYLRAGSFQRVPPNTKHRFRGLEDSLILEISTHHEESDSYRVEESRKVE